MIAECAQGRVEARQEGQAGRRTQESAPNGRRQRASLKRRSWESEIRANSGGGFVPLVLHDRGAEGREALNRLNSLGGGPPNFCIASSAYPRDRQSANERRFECIPTLRLCRRSSRFAA